MKTIIRSLRGASAVEFALIAPLLFLLLFGIIEFGLLLYNQAVITNASREGARKGVVYVVSSGTTGALSAAESAAIAHSGSALISLGTPSLPPDCSTNPCAEAENLDLNYNTGSRLSVAVRYNFKSLLIAPIIGEKLLSATTVMTYE